MYYSYNQETRDRDCEIDNITWGYNVSEYISNVKKSLADNYSGMASLPWDRNGTQYHTARHIDYTYYYENGTNTMKFRTNPTRNGIFVEEYYNGWQTKNYTSFDFTSSFCRDFDPTYNRVIQ